MARTLKQLEQKRLEAETELKEIEKLIYKVETNYLSKTLAEGNIVRGWESLINQKASKGLGSTRKLAGKQFSDKERLFSLSSVTSTVKLHEDLSDDRLLPAKRKLASTSQKMGSNKKNKTKKLDEDTDSSEEN